MYNATIEKRSYTKYVFMHHTRTNAIALNYGADSWQLAQIASATSLHSPLKLFLSPDFTAHACDLATTISEIKRFAGHPSQLKVNGGKVLVNSFEGLGEKGWEKLRTETEAWFTPFISGLEGRFGKWKVVDSWFW
ncbi:hypothetical protein H0H87_010662 [Tephrocybe sp. NHM501043]|nr:hypothetical protein H0H87_010662 [Tephrocybe sp. NHM501043]